MSITYTLAITQMDTVNADSEQDVVICVHWAYTGTADAGGTAQFGGTTTLTYSGGAFTPYNQLTEAQVTEWVLTAWTPEETEQRKEIIAAQIAVQTPPLPWAASAETLEPAVH